MEQLLLHGPEVPAESWVQLESEIGRRMVALMARAIYIVLVSEGGYEHEQGKPEPQDHAGASSA